jgi:hypothetical protein
LHPDGLLVGRLFIQLGLNRIEQGAVDNRRLFAFEDLPFEGGLADIEAIAKQIGERSPRERNARLPPGLRVRLRGALRARRS